MNYSYNSKQALAPNSTGGDSMSDYHGSDHGKLVGQEKKNDRMNDYITNAFAGPGAHSGPAKVKGQIEHSKQEDELGDDYK